MNYNRHNFGTHEATADAVQVMTEGTTFLSIISPSTHIPLNCLLLRLLYIEPKKLTDR